jgi:4-diphosphocytidyl-2-C-methyl-D-erythritol kinase
MMRRALSRGLRAWLGSKGQGAALDPLGPSRECVLRTTAPDPHSLESKSLLLECAPAKINFYLHVTGRRPNGYHLLDSLAVFAGACDTITAQAAEDLTLELKGPFGATLAVEPDNLVLRAARALAAEAGIPAHATLTLEKNLPIASGIGGGSADAAAALRILTRLWAISPPHGTLTRIAAALGADVPVCLNNTPARMAGIGEILSPGPALPSFGIALINPGIAVATPAIFRARQGPFSPPATLPGHWPDAAAMAAGLAYLTNDLQPPAEALCPAITDVLAALRATDGCLLARMSGSGATCFGLFANPAQAAAARAQARPGWWCWTGSAYHPPGGFTPDTPTP